VTAMARRRVLVSAFVALVALAPACSSDPSAAPRTTPPSPSASSPVVVEGTWASDAGAHSASVYFILANRGSADDTVVGATSDLATGVQIREPTAGGDLRTVANLPLPAGAELSFEPGGYDVLLTGVTEPLAVGSTVEFTLDLAHAGPVVVTAGIR